MLPELPVGTIVERYRIDAVIGQGGMASVYRVTHTSLGTEHALKVLHTEKPEVRERMLAEGRMQATLAHTNILAVRDVLDVDGSPGLLMDLVKGGSLADLMEKRGALEPELRDRLFTATVKGVAAAHKCEMVHRDLKPGNILLAEVDGELVPKIADFGLAKVLGGIDIRDHKTQQGVAMGTPSYMAPEQVFDAATADQRADIWALGVILYEMATGSRAFGGVTQIEVLGRVSIAHFDDPATVRPDLDAGVLAAIRGCLVLDPSQRIANCDVLLRVLAGTQEFVPPPALRRPPRDSASQTFIVDQDAETLEQVPSEEREAPIVALADTPEKPRNWGGFRRYARLLLLLIPALVAYSELSWPVDAQIQYPILRAVRGELQADDVVVVSFEGMRDAGQLRSQHPAVLDALVENGATAVLFDVALLRESEHDEDIAAAIRRAGEAGVPVVIPVFADDLQPRLPASKALREAGPLGLVEFQRELLWGTVVRAPMQRRSLDGRSWWHAAAQVTHAHLNAKREISFDGNTLVIGAARNPSWAGIVWLHPVGEIPRLAYDAPETWGDGVRGRVVVLGTFGGSPDLHLTPAGPRYGVEIQAALVQTLVRQAALRTVPLWVSALLALFTGVGMALLMARLGRRNQLVAWLFPTAIIGIVFALTLAGTVVAVTPLLLAVVLAWYAMRGLLSERIP